MARCRPFERYRSDGAAGVVTASTGNHAVATAWAADSLGLSATVFVPEGASRTKLAKLDGLGAELVVAGSDFDETKERAATYAEEAGIPFFEDGAEQAQLDGYAAIGDEIVDQLDGEAAAVVVPVGNGALLAGVGRALGARSPRTQRIGVVSSGAPVMAQSWRAGRPVLSDLCDTIADGLAVRVAIPMAVEWLLEEADAMLEVSEPEIAAAVVAFDDAGIRAERPRQPRSRLSPTSTPMAPWSSSSPAATSTTSCLLAAALAFRSYTSSGRRTLRERRKPRFTSSSVASKPRSSCSIETTKS